MHGVDQVRASLIESSVLSCLILQLANLRYSIKICRLQEVRQNLLFYDIIFGIIAAKDVNERFVF